MVFNLPCCFAVLGFQPNVYCCNIKRNGCACCSVNFEAVRAGMVLGLVMLNLAEWWKKTQ